MNYAQLREHALTGDILFQAGDTLGAKFLRVFTASQFSHVALLVWIDNNYTGEPGLWVAEVVPATGYTLSPASQRIREMLTQGNVWFAKAPHRTEFSRFFYHSAITSYRGNGDNGNNGDNEVLDPSYSFSSAVLTWFAQLTNQDIKVKLICSTFVQEVWERGGVEFDRPADPEDLVDYVHTLTRVGGEETDETDITAAT